METWEVFIKDHHEGYIRWNEHKRNQAQLASNAYGHVGDAKSGRGGRALLAGPSVRRSVYRCDTPNLQLGKRRCVSFAGKRVDAIVADEMFRAVAPMAIEAAQEAECMLRVEDQDRRRIADLCEQLTTGDDQRLQGFNVIGKILIAFAMPGSPPAAIG